MPKYYLLVALFSCTFLIACFDTTEHSVQAADAPFFDLKAYFDEEIDRLKSAKNFTKITEVNGEREENNVDTLNFSDELAAFINADINRVAWFDKYAVDSTFSVDGDLEKLAYKTEDKKLKTRQLQIDFNRTSVQKITIEQASESVIANSNKTLIYEPKRGYSIRSNQAVTMTADNAYYVEVKF